MKKKLKANRLGPVLIGLALSGAGVATLEWLAANSEGHYDRIEVADSLGLEDESDEVTDLSWQATAPEHPDHARARQLLRRGDVAEALTFYAGLVAGEEVAVPLLTEYAYALRQTGSCDEAEGIMARALKRAPGDAAVNLAAALTYRCLDRHDAALAAFEQAVELRPSHSTTRLAYGEFLLRSDNVDEAVRVLEPASEAGSNEERARALALLGRALFDRGQTQRAHSVLSEAIERAPAVVAIWMSVGRTYLRSDDRQDHVRALHYATRATRLAPELATAYSALGRAYEKLDMRRDALEAYERAARLDPGYEYVRTRLVHVALEEEEYATARRAARGLLRIDPDDAEHHFLNGLAAWRSGDADTARQSYAEANRLRDGQYAEAWYNLGILEREVGHEEEAKEAYQQAIEVRPDYAAAWNNLGLVHLDLEEHSPAEGAFQRAIALQSGYASALINLGSTYAAQDNYELAARTYERALANRPDDRTLRLRLAVAYRRTGRAERAIEIYRQLVADEPRYVSAWYNLGIALSSVDRDAEAQLAYQTALGIDPGHQRSLRNLGILEARDGQLRLAWSHLTDALDRDPSDHVVRLELAELSRGSNDLDRCAREARVVLAQAPGHEQALELLGMCTVASRE